MESPKPSGVWYIAECPAIIIKGILFCYNESHCALRSVDRSKWPRGVWFFIVTNQQCRGTELLARSVNRPALSSSFLRCNNSNQSHSEEKWMLLIIEQVFHHASMGPEVHYSSRWADGRWDYLCKWKRMSVIRYITVGLWFGGLFVESIIKPSSWKWWMFASQSRSRKPVHGQIACKMAGKDMIRHQTRSFFLLTACITSLTNRGKVSTFWEWGEGDQFVSVDPFSSTWGGIWYLTWRALDVCLI